SQKLALLFIRSPVAAEAHTISFENLAMNQVINRLAYENTRAKFRPEQFVAIRGCAVGGGNVAHGANIIEPLQGTRHREDASCILVVRKDPAGALHRQMRVARDVLFR